MIILITGSSGFIGFHLSEILCKDNNINVIDLSIVLNESSEEHFFCKSQVNPWAYQGNFNILIWWHPNEVLLKINSKISNWLQPVGKISPISKFISCIIFSVVGKKLSL